MQTRHAVLKDKRKAMQPFNFDFPQEPTVKRSVALKQLSKVRFPAPETQKINNSTLWRWCKIAAIRTGLKEFNMSQMGRLHLVAQYLRQGYSYAEVENQIQINDQYSPGNKNDQQQSAQTQSSSSAPKSSAFSFSDFYAQSNA